MMVINDSLRSTLNQVSVCMVIILIGSYAGNHTNSTILLKCMWVPGSDIQEDRHHLIHFRCKHCRRMKSACQYYGHYSDEHDLNCQAEKLKTVYDKPVCEEPECPDTDFMRATHNFFQTFQDKDGQNFCVFFDTLAEVQRFFRFFPAAKCLDDDLTWCSFVSVIHQHKSLLSFGQFKELELTVCKRPIMSGTSFRFQYVSGFLSNVL